MTIAPFPALPQSPTSARSAEAQSFSNPFPSTSADDCLFDRKDTFRMGGALVGGIGLGLLGAHIGMGYGMETAMTAFGSHPLGQVAGLLTVGLVLGLRSAIIGMAVGTAGGALLGFGAGELMARATE